MSYTYKYPRPAVTADCVVITKEAEPKVLLIQRGDQPFKGGWAFPGGFMNMDETTEQCAVRELKEETGLRLSKVQQIGVYSKVDRDPRGKLSPLLISLSLMNLLLSLARMMLPKLNGGHCRIYHIWHLTIMTSCRMRLPYIRQR